MDTDSDQVNVPLDSLNVSINNGKIVSWEAITVKAKTNLYEKAKSTACCQNSESNSEAKLLLNNINGLVKPGEMLAVMGASGSGKTTLLNAITQQTSKSLNVNGKVMVNGVEVDSKYMSSCSNFVQQTDLFFGTMTMREHLTFQAKLRMGYQCDEQKKLKRVDELLIKFQLNDKADSVRIGIPGIKKGISGGQMRRLSLAAEILTDSAILFCDEPTSGLDFNMANSLVKFLREEAERGKTIICTIHQPSGKTFAMFNKVCLLALGNQAFFGDILDANTFFTSKLKIELTPNSNPAEEYIDALGVDCDPKLEETSKERILGYCRTFKESDFCIKIETEIREIENTSDRTCEIVPFNYTPYKNGLFTEFFILLRRAYLNYSRNYQAFVIDFAMAILTAMLGGTIYFQSGEISEDGKCTFNQTIASNMNTALFYVVTVVFIISLLSAVLAFPLEIPIYFRENSAYIYRCETYYLSKFILEIPINISISFINATIMYFMAKFGCSAENYFYFLFVVILIAQSSYALGHILSILGANVTASISLAAPAIAFQMLFSGFFLKKAETAPEIIKFLKFVSVFNYGFDLLMINQWEKIEELKCPYSEIAEFNGTYESALNVLDRYRFELNSTSSTTHCAKDGAEILQGLMIKPANSWIYVLMLFVLLAVFRLTAFLILKLKSKTYKRPKQPKELTFFKQDGSVLS